MSRKMKDSGIEWIGEIPEDWEIVKVKNIFNNHKNIVCEKENEYERLALTLNGVIKRSKEDSKGLQSESFSTYQVIYENDLVFKLIDLENVNTSRVGKSPYTGIVSPVYIILSNERESAFGYYYFLSLWHREIFNKLGGNGVRSALNLNDLNNLPYPQFDTRMKKYVAEYLDTRCTLIDQTIEKQKQVIEKLKEYKQSVITEAVTKGLNQNVLMKDSGSVYWGEMPENWTIKRLKYVFSIVKRIAGKEGYNVLSITQNGIKVKDLSNNEGQIAQDYSNYQLVEVGDFAMNHMDLLTGWVDVSKYNGVTSPDYRVFIIDDEKACDSRYYLHLMQTCYRNKIFYGLGQGVSSLGRWRLQADKFLNFLIPVPSLEEQKAIAEYIDDKCKSIDAAISVKGKVLEKLESYKKSLIYECVTGKREVN